MTTKQGPNGFALYSALRELPLLSKSMRKDLEILGGSNLDLVRMELSEILEELGSYEGLLLDPGTLLKATDLMRKLSIVKSPEGKCRVIAIYDYWSQCSLKPLHEAVISRLDKWFPGNDMTRNQSGFNPAS